MKQLMKIFEGGSYFRINYTLTCAVQNGKQLITAHANENPAQKDMKSTVNTYTYIEEASENMKVNTKEKRCCSEPESCKTSPTTLCELPVIMENIRAACS